MDAGLCSFTYYTLNGLSQNKSCPQLKNYFSRLKAVYPKYYSTSHQSCFHDLILIHADYWFIHSDLFPDSCQCEWVKQMIARSSAMK